MKHYRGMSLTIPALYSLVNIWRQNEIDLICPIFDSQCLSHTLLPGHTVDFQTINSQKVILVPKANYDDVVIT